MQLKICELVYKRVFNGITQDQVSISTKVSIRSIQRFEAGKLDSLSLFMYYKNQFEHLPSRNKTKIPDWVNC